MTRAELDAPWRWTPEDRLLPRFEVDAVLDAARDRLAGFKRPRAVHYVEALPRNDLGKVLRHELRG